MKSTTRVLKVGKYTTLSEIETRHCMPNKNIQIGMFETH